MVGFSIFFFFLQGKMLQYIARGAVIMINKKWDELLKDEFKKPYFKQLGVKEIEVMLLKP